MECAVEFTLLAFRVSFSHGITLNSKEKNLSVVFSHSFSRLKYEVSKHEQLRKIINLWPIWEGEWGCQLSEMYAFSIWHFLMPASFSHRTVKLPFLLVLIERSPRSLPTPSCIAHLSLFVGSQCGCPFHWLWESTSSYLFVPWHGHDALDQAGHLKAGNHSRTASFTTLCYSVHWLCEGPLNWDRLSLVKLFTIDI